MLEKLSQRDVRALRFGIAGIAIFALFYLALSGISRWKGIRSNIEISTGQLQTLATAKPSDEIRQIMSVLKIPQNEETQRNLFRTEFNSQLSRSGIRAQPIKVTTADKSPKAGYKTLFLECKAKGNFDQVLDFLANLQRNPYLVGIEKLVITKSDARNQQSRDVNIEIKVSSFVKR
jgi:hypothetical protein